MTPTYEQKLAMLAENKDFAIFNELTDVNDKLEKIVEREAPETMNVKLEGVSVLTIKGDTPTKEELLSIIEPLIPSVKDGHTPTKEELLSIIRPLIPKVENGKTPTKEELLTLIRPLIPKVENGKTPTDEYLLSLIIPLIPKIESLENDIPRLGTQIRDGLELLQGDERLDKKSIKGLDDYEEVAKLAKTPHYGGVAGIKEIIAGAGISIDKTHLAYPVISATGGAGSGDVVGPASATDGVPALFDGTTGKLIKNSTPTGTGNPVMHTSPTLVTPVLGAASATSIEVTGTAGAGFINMVGQSSEPTAPPAGTAQLHAITDNGFTRFELDNESGADYIIGQDNVFIAKNVSGGAITKGQVVYVFGSVGKIPTVKLAKGDAIATSAATIGIATETTTADNAFGQFMISGILDSVDTSAFVAGNVVYVSAATAGALTATKPAYPNFQKSIGVILNSGVGNGSILINVAPFLGGTETGTNGDFSVTGTFAGNGTGRIGKSDFTEGWMAVFQTSAALGFGTTTDYFDASGTGLILDWGVGHTMAFRDHNNAGVDALFDFSTLTTANRTYAFPNKSGTVAMTSDITGTNSGTNTGDETATSIGALIGGAGDATPNDTDFVATSLTAGGILKKITWTNVKAFLKTYFDTVYAALAGSVSQAFSVASLEVGHATDTTITRVSAGVAAVEGNAIVTVAGATMTGAIVTADHGTATNPEVVSVVYGTGSAPTASTTPIGTLFVKYTA